MRAVLTLAAAVAAVLIPAGADATVIELVVSPAPQSYTNTCQSYALAYSLGTFANSPYPIETTRQLRTLELELRRKIEAVAARDELTPYHHSVWQTAVAEFTSGQFRLNREEFSSEVPLAARIADLTGIDAAETLGPVVSSLLIETPVLLSFTRIGASSYANGHIVPVLGTSGNAQARRKLLLLNPAVKAGGSAPTRSLCSQDTLPGDERYSALTSIESDYTFKDFSGRLVLMWLSR